jgi:hypothetical protein
MALIGSIYLKTDILRFLETNYSKQIKIWLFFFTHQDAFKLGGVS